MSLDQAIVDSLVLLLSRITLANGYASDAGRTVLTEIPREDEVPEGAVSLAILDEAETLDGEGQSYLRRRGLLTVRVEGALPVSLAGPQGVIWQPVRAQARQLMADVRRAVAQQRLEAFPAGVTGLRITGRSLPPLEEGASLQLCSVTFAFAFTESHSPKE